MRDATYFCCESFQNKADAVCRCLHRRLPHRYCAERRRWLERAFAFNVRIDCRAFNSERPGSTNSNAVGFTRPVGQMHATRDEMIKLVVAMTVTTLAIFAGVPSCFGTTTRLGQIVTASVGGGRKSKPWLPKNASSTSPSKMRPWPEARKLNEVALVPAFSCSGE